MSTLVCPSCGGVGEISHSTISLDKQGTKGKGKVQSHNQEAEQGVGCSSCNGTGIFRTFFIG